MSRLTKEREAELEQLLNREWSDSDAGAFAAAALELHDEGGALRGELAEARQRLREVVVDNATLTDQLRADLAAAIEQYDAMKDSRDEAVKETWTLGSRTEELERELSESKACVAELEDALNDIALCDEPGGCECSDMAQDFLDKAELAAVAKESK